MARACKDIADWYAENAKSPYRHEAALDLLATGEWTEEDVKELFGLSDEEVQRL